MIPTRIEDTDSCRWELFGDAALRVRSAESTAAESTTAESTAADLERLVFEAREVKERAYAPYSNFRVGSAVRMDGEFLATGTNVENASYGGTICAERSAVVQGVSRGARRIDAIAISTDSSSTGETGMRAPCGLCRQFISEFADDEALVLLDAGSTGGGRIRIEVLRFGDLLPHRFRLDSSG